PLLDAVGNDVLEHLGRGQYGDLEPIELQPKRQPTIAVTRRRRVDDPRSDKRPECDRASASLHRAPSHALPQRILCPRAGLQRPRYYQEHQECTPHPAIVSDRDGLVLSELDPGARKLDADAAGVDPDARWLPSGLRRRRHLPLASDPGVGTTV